MIDIEKVHGLILEMDKDEAKQRLFAIADLAKNRINSGTVMLTSEYDFLNDLFETTFDPSEEEKVEHISRMSKDKLDYVILSCSASLTKNPGGEAAIGVFLEFKEETPMELVRKSKKSNTNNQGEYDAIYFGLTQLMSLKNNPGCEIEVRSDNKIIVDQLNGKIECKNPELQKRKDSILELVKSLPVPVYILWKPKNSTPGLKKASSLSQSML